MDSKGRMPLGWLDPAHAMPPCPPRKQTVSLRYWELCRMTRCSADHGMEFFRTFEALADAVLTLLITTEEPPSSTLDDAYAGLWLQVKLIRNEDRVLRIVQSVASSRYVRCLRGYVKHFAQCGCLPYALALAKSLRGRRNVVMADFARQIQDEIDNENAVRLVLSVSIKDHGSLFHQLGADLLRLVIDAARQPEIVLWEDVLRAFVVHDVGTEI